MKANVGKQTGIALALLATLMATFFAMGVFSVAQADTHSATRSISLRLRWHLADEVTVTIALSAVTEDYGHPLTETLPDGVQLCLRLRRVDRRQRL